MLTCKAPHKKEILKLATGEAKGTNHFENVIEVKQFGDSVRLEVEKRGDTLIKHFIDLKGLSNDNFDDSYNSVCTYRQITNDFSVSPTASITNGGFKFYFDRQKVLDYCDSIINQLTGEFDLQVTKPRYLGLRAYVMQQNQKETEASYDAEVLTNFRTKIVDPKSSIEPKSLLIEFYKTEFSGGQNFYVITQTNDTVQVFHNMDYIN